MDINRICINCMKEKAFEGGPCPFCGFVNENYRPAADSLLPLTPLRGRYLLGRVLGSGGFGITYIARDMNLQVNTAVKELYLKEICMRGKDGMVQMAEGGRRCFDESKARFLQEARILAMFHEKEKEGIVMTRDYFEENGTAYIVMELLEGKTLKEQVESSGRLVPAQMQQVMQPICHALIKIHSFGVLHLDVSPDNIMLTSEGARLLDFGGASIPGRDRPGAISYKRGYSPPEQRKPGGRIGPWTDIYAAAAVVYFCLTGEKAPDIAAEGMDRSFASGSGKIPGSLRKTLAKALDPKPENRFQTMEDFWNSLHKRERPVPVKLLVFAGMLAASLALGSSMGFGVFRDEGAVQPQTGSRTADTLQSRYSSAEETGHIIQEGTYIFENAEDRNLIMGIDSGFGDDGSALVLKNYQDRNENRFFVTGGRDSFYHLQAAHTNSYIETEGLISPGAALGQFADLSESGTESWSFIFCGHDEKKNMDKVIIINRAGTVMAPAKTAAGEAVVLAKLNLKDESQKWYMRWNEKDPSQPDVRVYREGDLVEDIQGLFNVSSALDGMTSMCVSRDEKYYKEPALVVFRSRWLTEKDRAFAFRFVPAGAESRYRIYPADQGTNEEKCLELDPDTRNIVIRSKSNKKEQLFRIVYVRSNTCLIQACDESVLGFDLLQDGTAEGMHIISRPYKDLKDSRLESWILVKPHEN